MSKYRAKYRTSLSEKISIKRKKAKYFYSTFKPIYSNYTLIFSDFDIYENCATIGHNGGQNKIFRDRDAVFDKVFKNENTILSHLILNKVLPNRILH